MEYQISRLGCKEYGAHRGITSIPCSNYWSDLGKANVGHLVGMGRETNINLGPVVTISWNHCTEKCARGERE